MSDDPIFIIGTERSGSNLLRLILNAHSRIAVPHPPHIVRYFAPLEKYYLRARPPEESFARLVDDIVRFVDRHIHPWNMALDRAQILATADPRDVIGVFAAIYEQYRAHTGKARWGCKSTFLIDYTDRILARFPNAKLILLVRDPRDVAVSSRESVFNPFHPYVTAQLWARQQQRGLTLLRSLSPQTIRRVRYEDVLADPLGAVENLCEFLDEPFEEGMLRYYDTADAQRTASLCASWRNASQRILSENTAKFHQQLGPSEIAAVEQVAGEVMVEFGYGLSRPSVAAARTYADGLQWRLLGLWWFLKTEGRSLIADENHWRRWRRTLGLSALKVRLRLAQWNMQQ
jgi:hypothetical protein